MTDRDVERFWEKVQKQDGDGCWLWTASKNQKGYGTFHLINDTGNRVTAKAHRFSWELHNGPIPQDLCVLHTCDVPLCVRPDHLWLGTIADNNRDMCVKGRGASLKTHGPANYRRGEQHWCAKLTEENVREIRVLKASGMSQRSVAKRFGMSDVHVSEIVHRKTWRHVE